jgi:hypothetical protein
MAKQPTTKSGSNATEALVQVIETVLPFRAEGTPTLDVIARLAAQGSRLLRLEKDELASVQNAATLQLMKRYKLIAD